MFGLAGVLLPVGHGSRTQLQQPRSLSTEQQSACYPQRNSVCSCPFPPTASPQQTSQTLFTTSTGPESAPVSIQRITTMTEAAAVGNSNNIDLKPPPNRTRPRNASDASDFQLFETDSYKANSSLSSSYETSNRKRLRSGSVSGRLRSASEYLEEKGLLDRQTKGIMKDLIIIGDEDLQKAIDKYESGDPSQLEEMIQSGALQNRLPKDLDILGDLDLDFLTMDESSLLGGGHTNHQTADEAMDETAAHQLQQLHSSMISPDDEEEEDYDDDIVGDLEFHDEYGHDRLVSDSPSSELSELERRNRSNSLFSALINTPSTNALEPSSYGRWMDPDLSSVHSKSETILPNPTHPEPATDAPAIKIRKKKGRRPKTASSMESNLTKSLRESDKKKKKPRKPKANSDETEIETTNDEPVHVLGRPRSWSDPQLSVTIDEDGLRNVERPEGWVGAYSPDSRKERIKRFLAKRRYRVWTKSVKYSVRKDFANSRLRVKGRFVKKEDETLMRELMSLT